MGLVVVFSMFGVVFSFFAIKFGYQRINFIHLYSFSNIIYLFILGVGLIAFFSSTQMFFSMSFPKEVSTIKEIFSVKQKIYDSRFSLEKVDLLEKQSQNNHTELFIRKIRFQNNDPFKLIDEEADSLDDTKMGTLLKFKDKSWIIYYDSKSFQHIIRQVTDTDAKVIQEYYFPSLLKRDPSNLEKVSNWFGISSSTNIAIKDGLVLSFMNDFSKGSLGYLIDLNTMEMKLFSNSAFSNIFKEDNISIVKINKLGYLISINSKPEPYSAGANPHTVATRSDLYLLDGNNHVTQILVRSISIGRINRLFSYENQTYLEIIDDRDESNQYDRTRAKLSYYKLLFSP